MVNYLRGSKIPKSSIKLTSQIVGLERAGKNIIVGCMNQTIGCYSMKGKKLWKLEMPANIITMIGMDLKSKGFQAIVVSLNNNEVYLYKDKYLISKFTTQDTVVGIKFGRFGREDSNLIMTTKSKFKFSYVFYVFCYCLKVI